MGKGRQTLLTPEFQAEAVRLAKAGVPQQVIADALRIHAATFSKWMRWGDERWIPDKDAEQPQDREPYRVFREAIREAQARPVMVCEATWLRAVHGTPAVPADKERGTAAQPAVPGDAKAAERWLRLHRPDLYREQIDVTHGGSIEVEASKVTEALAAYHDVIGKLVDEQPS